MDQENTEDLLIKIKNKLPNAFSEDQKQDFAKEAFMLAGLIVDLYERQLSE